MRARGNAEEIQGVCSWKKGHPLRQRAARPAQPQVTIAQWIQVSLQGDVFAKRSFLQTPVPALSLLPPTCHHKL